MKGKIFKTQEVQAIITGNKTMFREVIKPYPVLSDDKSYWEFEGVRWAGEKSSYAKNFGDNARPEMPDLCPYQIGQKIFCKESFCRPRGEVLYCADFESDSGYEWLAASYMGKFASRLFPIIKEIRVERLQSISQEDCAKEGIKHTMWQANGRLFSAPGEPIEIGFARLWNATHKKPEEKFEANPFVFVYQFETIK
tara:strand:+ start:5657 stop:6244 length:588 start_codon:yes stop_codon:yes gene_type:complete